MIRNAECSECYWSYVLNKWIEVDMDYRTLRICENFGVRAPAQLDTLLASNKSFFSIGDTKVDELMRTVVPTSTQRNEICD